MHSNRKIPPNKTLTAVILIIALVIAAGYITGVIIGRISIRNSSTVTAISEYSAYSSADVSAVSEYHQKQIQFRHHHHRYQEESP